MGTGASGSYAGWVGRQAGQSAGAWAADRASGARRSGGWVVGRARGNQGNPSCFDPVFTYERCCRDAEDDADCWRVARANVAQTIRMTEPHASVPGNEGMWQHIEALHR